MPPKVGQSGAPRFESASAKAESLVGEEVSEYITDKTDSGYTQVKETKDSTTGRIFAREELRFENGLKVRRRSRTYNKQGRKTREASDEYTEAGRIGKSNVWGYDFDDQDRLILDTMETFKFGRMVRGREWVYGYNSAGEQIRVKDASENHNQVCINSKQVKIRDPETGYLTREFRLVGSENWQTDFEQIWEEFRDPQTDRLLRRTHVTPTASREEVFSYDEKAGRRVKKGVIEFGPGGLGGDRMENLYDQKVGVLLRNPDLSPVNTVETGRVEETYIYDEETGKRNGETKLKYYQDGQLVGSEITRVYDQAGELIGEPELLRPGERIRVEAHDEETGRLVRKSEILPGIRKETTYDYDKQTERLLTETIVDYDKDTDKEKHREVETSSYDDQSGERVELTKTVSEEGRESYYKKEAWDPETKQKVEEIRIRYNKTRVDSREERAWDRQTGIKTKESISSLTGLKEGLWDGETGQLIKSVDEERRDGQPLNREEVFRDRRGRRIGGAWVSYRCGQQVSRRESSRNPETNQPVSEVFIKYLNGREISREERVWEYDEVAGNLIRDRWSYQKDGQEVDCREQTWDYDDSGKSLLGKTLIKYKDGRETNREDERYTYSVAGQLLGEVLTRSRDGQQTSRTERLHSYDGETNQQIGERILNYDSTNRLISETDRSFDLTTGDTVGEIVVEHEKDCQVLSERDWDPQTGALISMTVEKYDHESQLISRMELNCRYDNETGHKIAETKVKHGANDLVANRTERTMDRRTGRWIGETSVSFDENGREVYRSEKTWNGQGELIKQITLNLQDGQLLKRNETNWGPTGQLVNEKTTNYRGDHKLKEITTSWDGWTRGLAQRTMVETHYDQEGRRSRSTEKVQSGAGALISKISVKYDKHDQELRRREQTWVYDELTSLKTEEAVVEFRHGQECYSERKLFKWDKEIGCLVEQTELVSTGRKMEVYIQNRAGKRIKLLKAFDSHNEEVGSREPNWQPINGSQMSALEPQDQGWVRREIIYNIDWLGSAATRYIGETEMQYDKDDREINRLEATYAYQYNRTNRPIQIQRDVRHEGTGETWREQQISTRLAPPW